MYIITVTLRVFKSDRKNSKVLAIKEIQAFVGDDATYLKNRLTYDNQCDLEELVKHYANEPTNRISVSIYNTYFSSHLYSPLYKRGNALTLAIRNAICTANGMAEAIEKKTLAKTTEVE